MIRINLLPRGERALATGGTSQVWVISYVAGAVVWIAALVVFYLMTASELKDLQARNADLQRKIDELKQQSADLDSIKAKLEKSKQLEEVVNKLQRARLGPTNVMLELARVLSQGGRPTVDEERLQQMREDNPLAGYSPNWDGRRLWLTSFTEENRECRIQGLGKTNDDVAEFLRRLAVSEYFEEVTLQRSQAQGAQTSDNRMIAFDVSCKVRY